MRSRYAQETVKRVKQNGEKKVCNIILEKNKTNIN